MTTGFVHGRKISVRLSTICIAVLCFVLSACGGGGSSGNNNGSMYSSSSSNNGSNVPVTTLSCDGFPKAVPVSVNNSVQTYTAVCLILTEYAQVTPSLSVSTNAGNLSGHGKSVDMLNMFVVYARIVATAADEGRANALAKSVVINTTNGKVSSTPDQFTAPESLQVDFEVFTQPSTNLTLTANDGNVAVDNYNAILNLTTVDGNVDLHAVQGQETVNATNGNINVIFSGPSQGQEIFNTNNGDIDITLTGTSFAGTGMTAKVTNAGGISVSRPSGYQAAFSAKTDIGIASIDSNMVTAPPTPAVVTSGSGAPISLESKTGNVSVVTAEL